MGTRTARPLHLAKMIKWADVLTPQELVRGPGKQDKHWPPDHFDFQYIQYLL